MEAPHIHHDRAPRLLLLLGHDEEALHYHIEVPRARQGLHTHRQLGFVCMLSADDSHDCLHILLAQRLRRIEAALGRQAPVHTESGVHPFRLPVAPVVGNKSISVAWDSLSAAALCRNAVMAVGVSPGLLHHAYQLQLIFHTLSLCCCGSI